MRVLQSIEQGYTTWETLSQTIDSAAWTFARDLVQPKGKQQGQGQVTKGQGQNSQKLCSTYNTFKKEGCAYENSNPGETCMFVHQCSACNKRGFPNRKHKSKNCRDEARLNSNSNTPAPQPLTSNSAPPVTSV